MTISFTQTDTNAVCGAAVYCSPKTLNGSRSLKQATVGGTAGVTEVTPQNIDASASNLIAVFFECIVGDGVSWDAGTWTVKLNVTSASNWITWVFLDICRIDSSCTNQASIASGSLSIALDTTGVKTTTISGSVQTPSSGDKVMVLLVFSNSSGIVRNFGYTPNQNIDSPFSTSIPANSLMLMGAGI